MTLKGRDDKLDQVIDRATKNSSVNLFNRTNSVILSDDLKKIVNKYAWILKSRIYLYCQELNYSAEDVFKDYWYKNDAMNLSIYCQNGDLVIEIIDKCNEFEALEKTIIVYDFCLEIAKSILKNDN